MQATRVPTLTKPNQIQHRSRTLSLLRTFAVMLASALALFFVLHMPALAQTDAPASGPESTLYEVVSGDTLFEIAARYGLTMDELGAANGIVNVDLIAPGQVLVIPNTGAQLTSGQPARANVSTETVAALPGDTLALIANRVGQDPTVLATLNQITVTQRLFPGQPLTVLDSYSAPSTDTFGAVRNVDLTNSLIQGKAGYIAVTSRKPVELRGDWNGLPLIFTPSGENLLRQVALLPVPALLAPAPYTLTIAYTAYNNVELSKSWFVNVVEGDYGRVEIVTDDERAGLLAPDIVQSELELLSAVWGQTSPEPYWTDVFTRPISTEYETSDPYGTRRSYNGGPYNGYHSGNDFGAPVGVTVTAPADAIVALSAPLQVRGNVVVLDHGRGVFSGYWHLSESFVEEGQAVKQGEPIALVGNTGLSTGSHLHWELRVNSIAVDPIWFLDHPLLP